MSSFEFFETHGTPYDQDHVESYVPPGLYGVMVEDDNQNISPATPCSQGGRFRSSEAMILGMSLFTAGIAATGVFSEHSVDTSNLHCANDPHALREISEEEASSAMQTMEFAMTDERYEVLESKILDLPSDDFEGLGQVLNDIFMEYNMRVKIGELPAPTGPNPPVLEQDLSRYFNFPNVQMNSLELLKSLSVVPASLLREIAGTRLYLTGELQIDGEVVNGAHIRYGMHSQPAILVNIVPNGSDAIVPADEMFDSGNPGNIFLHELGHGLAYATCGVAIATNDKEFTTLNPAGFEYTEVDEDQAKAWQQFITASEYGASDPHDDIADATVYLLRRGNNYFPNSSDGGALYAKLDLLEARYSLIEPALPEYATFRALKPTSALPLDTYGPSA